MSARTIAAAAAALVLGAPGVAVAHGRPGITL